MRVISEKRIKDFYLKHPETEEALKSWLYVVRRANWKTPADVKGCYNTASILKDGRAVFDVCGGSYRMVTWINYKLQIIYIRFLGTHKEYDKIDANTV